MSGTHQHSNASQAQIVQKEAGRPDVVFKRVVKLFTPDAQCTWLLTELGNDDIAYGLCDLGMGTPELGLVCPERQRVDEAKGQIQNALRLRPRSTRTRTHRHLTGTTPPASGPQQLFLIYGAISDSTL
jgi:hypothetical protein